MKVNSLKRTLSHFKKTISRHQKSGCLFLVFLIKRATGLLIIWDTCSCLKKINCWNQMTVIGQSTNIMPELNRSRGELLHLSSPVQKWSLQFKKLKSGDWKQKVSLTTEGTWLKIYNVISIAIILYPFYTFLLRDSSTQHVVFELVSRAIH